MRRNVGQLMQLCGPYTYRPEMAHGKRESNGKRSRSVEAGPERVTRGEDREDQYEGDEHLNTEDLSQRHSVHWHWSTEQGVSIKFLFSSEYIHHNVR